MAEEETRLAHEQLQAPLRLRRRAPGGDRLSRVNDVVTMVT